MGHDGGGAVIRIVIGSAQVARDTISLTPEQSHYLFRVMRAKPGQKVEALVSGQMLYVCAVTQQPDLLLQVASHAVAVSVSITLAQSLLKKDLFSQIIEKGTEAGISCFVPLVTERSIVREISAAKQQRWPAIAQEATEQCRQSRVPRIEKLSTLGRLAEFPAAVKLLLDPDGVNIMDWLAHSQSEVRDWLIAAGPEGGLSGQEISGLRSAGFTAVSLGPYIYRAENAGTVAAGILTSWAFSSLSSPGDHF